MSKVDVLVPGNFHPPRQCPIVLFFKLIDFREGRGREEGRERERERNNGFVVPFIYAFIG